RHRPGVRHEGRQGEGGDRRARRPHLLLLLRSLQERIRGAARMNRLALSATVHCLTGCAIGEVLGMILSTWWGWGGAASIVMSVALALFYGSLLTSLPLLRSGMYVRHVPPLAFPSDTAPITTMAIVANLSTIAV